uniref:BBS2_N domain-containing protein n=1 Tax=Heterorhabditis bacteriophora TaxID=37862 RepID=A0A1I7XV96_HETBA
MDQSNYLKLRRKHEFPDSESSLHIPDKIKCITTVPFGNGYDYIVVGTESQIIVYDFYYNSTVFQREVPDGINCFALIVGSPDSEIRVFKNDLMRAELLETDSVVVLQGMNK